MTNNDIEFAVATFHSTHAVLKAEKILQEAGIENVRLVPVPSRISSDCGVTVRFLAADAPRVKDLLKPFDDLEGIFVQHLGNWEPFTTTRLPPRDSV